MDYQQGELPSYQRRFQLTDLQAGQPVEHPPLPSCPHESSRRRESPSDLCPQTMSDIRVSVQWKNSSVFAGEDLECVITFKNVSQAHYAPKSPSPNSQPRVASFGRDRWKESLPQHSANRSLGHTRNNSVSNAEKPSQAILRGHKPALSLSNPHSIRQNPATGLKDTTKPTVNSGHDGRHRRSVSIVSISGDPLTSQYDQKQRQASIGKRPGRNHARATSLQALPRNTSMGKFEPTSCKLRAIIARLLD